MNGRADRSTLPAITVRLSPAEKQWFATLARSRGVSESRLARSAIRSIADSSSLDLHAAGPRTLATDRITLRLRAGDGQAIVRRAAEREMRPSAYLSALVRAHLAIDPPLPGAELAALKLGIAMLVKVGTLLAQTVRNPALSSPELAEVRQDVSRLRAAVAALEGRMHALVRKAIASWETRA